MFRPIFTLLLVAFALLSPDMANAKRGSGGQWNSAELARICGPNAEECANAFVSTNAGVLRMPDEITLREINLRRGDVIYKQDTFGWYVAGLRRHWATAFGIIIMLPLGLMYIAIRQLRRHEFDILSFMAGKGWMTLAQVLPARPIPNKKHDRKAWKQHFRETKDGLHHLMGERYLRKREHRTGEEKHARHEYRISREGYARLEKLTKSYGKRRAIGVMAD